MVQISINNNRDFTILRRDGNENVKNNKSNVKIGLVNKTTALHLHPTFFLNISLPFLDDYDVKFANFTFYGGRKRVTTKSYSLSKLEYNSLKKFNSGRVRLHLTT